MRLKIYIAVAFFCLAAFNLYPNVGYSESGLEGGGSDRSSEEFEGEVSATEVSTVDISAVEVSAQALHTVYGLEVAVPSNWKTLKEENGKLVAIDEVLTDGYKRNLIVMSFEGETYIDEISAKRFQGLVNTQYKKGLKSVTDYLTQEPEFVTLENGNEAILMYSSFSLNGQDLMHIHLVVSSMKRHFLVTYTDLHSHLSGENSESFQLAWNILSNISVPFEKGGFRYQTTYFAVGGVVLVFLFLILFSMIRRGLEKKKLANFNVDSDDIESDLANDNQWVVEDEAYDEGMEEDDAIDKHSKENFEESA